MKENGFEINGNGWNGQENGFNHEPKSTDQRMNSSFAKYKMPLVRFLTQEGKRRPDFWSPLAIKVVASKYFWGDQKKNERENSVEMLIGRVSRFFGRQAVKQKYFNEEEAVVLKDEIAAICLNQMAVFNSPVWFNAVIQEYDNNA